ncbi:MAG: hypothetical protein JNL97_03840, partial [Verrucomicrobiales bacterium]|nr:hypothetical protein [Verrucomicrobiales bacterium]
MKRAESQVVVAVLMPHAPVLVPGVGGDRARAVARTIGALTTAAGRIVETRPDAVVVVSPHASRRGDRVPVYLGERVRGSLEDFGAPERSVDLPVAGRLVTELERDSRFRGSLAPLRDTRLDHGALVPLWHVQEAGWDGPVLVLGPNAEDAAPLEALGRALAAAASRASMSIALVASGDLSHRLRPGAPSGYDPRAGEFDRALMDCIREGAFGRVRDLDPELRELAAEDAVEPLI